MKRNMKLLLIAGLLAFVTISCGKENNNDNGNGNGYNSGQSEEGDPTDLGYTYVGTTANGGACYDLCQTLGYTGTPYYEDNTGRCYCK